MDIYQLSALELGKQIKEGAISVEEAVKAVFSRIHETEDTCQCYITLCEEQALLRAKEVQKAIQEGSLSSPLAGVPMAVKDNLCTKGIETTCGSLMLKGFRPFYRATAVKKLEDAGAILIGKLNMDGRGDRAAHHQRRLLRLGRLGDGLGCAGGTRQGDALARDLPVPVHRRHSAGGVFAQPAVRPGRRVERVLGRGGRHGRGLAFCLPPVGEGGIGKPHKNRGRRSVNLIIAPIPQIFQSQD